MNVLVMGMHRSGTSAVAAALAAAGLYAGPEEHQMPARDENPAGFAELVPVMEFNDQLLHALGWTWDAPAAAPAEEPPALDELVEEGRGLVGEMMGGRSPWLVKDPRLSLLLPWWRRMLDDRFIGVVVVRPAQEVARSLAARNGLPVEYGLALQAAYHRHLADGLAGLPVVVVHYVALTARPAETVASLLSGLTELGLGWTPDAQAASAAIQPSLRKTVPRDEAPRDRVIGAWSSGQVIVHERFSLAVDAPTEQQATLLAVRRPARVEQESARLAARAEVDRLLEMLERNEAEKRELQAHLARLDGTIATQADTIAAQGAQLNRRLHRLASRIYRLRDRLSYR